MVVVAEEEFRRLKGDVTGAALVAATQASPLREIDIEPKRAGMQPQPQLTAGSPGHGVPVHVFSRSAALVDPFVARGYRRGMWHHTARRASMADFLEDFSSADQTDSAAHSRTSP